MEYKEPSLAYKAITLIRDNKQYGDEIARAIRNFERYSPEQLNKLKIVVDGKIDAEALWNHINNTARGLIGKYFRDPNDFNYFPPFPAIKNVVAQIGRNGITPDLINAVIGTYQTTASNYVDTKDQQMVASMPTENGKEGALKIAEITGNKVIYGPWINSRTDPTEVSAAKAQFESQLREKVTTAVATGTIDDLLKEAA